jgi:pimeloyl-ACP methyl ester carboxylesterase
MLLPGLAGEDWIWRSTVEELTRAGHGTLVWNAAVAQLDVGDPSSILAELRSGAIAVLDDLSIEEVLVCGNSLGALLGLDFAGKHPDRTAGLVVSGCPGLGEKIVDASYLVSHGEREILDEYRSQMFYSEPESLPPELIEEAMQMTLHRPTMIKMLKVLRAANLHDTVGSIRSVTCPTSLIWGEHDRITPLENWRPHIAEFHDAELHVVLECGHSPMIEKVDQWLALLMEFVRQVIPGIDQDEALRSSAAPAS